MNNLYLLYQKLYILLMCYAKKMDLEVQRVCTGFLEIRSFFAQSGWAVFWEQSVIA